MTLTMAELKVLLALTSGPLTLKELSRKLNLSKGTLSNPTALPRTKGPRCD
ncbi:ArsR family transcriptional regulator [Thermococcus sp. M39]|uniref:ArsR family transcriptional regulator n=1 Tax=Thermococcus sp. M39 TaxID=1638262 RepID=UPI00143A3F55|nr:ArsR family transcriptional regulator [Thermococcus sp. M39]